MELVKSIWKIVVASARSCLTVIDQSLSEAKVAVSTDDGQMSLIEVPLVEVIARRTVSVVVATIGTVLMSSTFGSSVTAQPLSSSFISIAQELWRGGV